MLIDLAVEFLTTVPAQMPPVVQPGAGSFSDVLSEATQVSGCDTAPAAPVTPRNLAARLVTALGDVTIEQTEQAPGTRLGHTLMDGEAPAEHAALGVATKRATVDRATEDGDEPVSEEPAGALAVPVAFIVSGYEMQTQVAIATAPPLTGGRAAGLGLQTDVPVFEPTHRYIEERPEASRAENAAAAPLSEDHVAGYELQAAIGVVEQAGPHVQGRVGTAHRADPTEPDASPQPRTSTETTRVHVVPPLCQAPETMVVAARESVAASEQPRVVARASRVEASAETSGESQSDIRYAHPMVGYAAHPFVVIPLSAEPDLPEVGRDVVVPAATPAPDVTKAQTEEIAPVLRTRAKTVDVEAAETVDVPARPIQATLNLGDENVRAVEDIPRHLAQSVRSTPSPWADAVRPQAPEEPEPAERVTQIGHREQLVRPLFANEAPDSLPEVHSPASQTREPLQHESPPVSPSSPPREITAADATIEAGTKPQHLAFTTRIRTRPLTPEAQPVDSPAPESKGETTVPAAESSAPKASAGPESIDRKPQVETHTERRTTDSRWPVPSANFTTVRQAQGEERPDVPAAPAVRSTPALAEEKAAPQAQLRDVTVRIPTEAGDSSVSLRFAHRNGQVDVTVRSSSQDMARALQRDVPAFVERLESRGFETDLRPAARHDPASGDERRQPQPEWWEESQNRRPKKPFWELEHDD